MGVRVGRVRLAMMQPRPVPASPVPSECAYFALPPATYPHAAMRHCRGQLVRRRPRRASGKRASRVWLGICSDCPLSWRWRGI
jgi:hypothetical protein